MRDFVDWFITLSKSFNCESDPHLENGGGRPQVPVTFIYDGNSSLQKIHNQDMTIKSATEDIQVRNVTDVICVSRDSLPPPLKSVSSSLLGYFIHFETTNFVQR